CTYDAECVIPKLRPKPWFNTTSGSVVGSPDSLICECKDLFYTNGTKCHPSKGPGKPCTGLGQCVHNAECQTPYGGVCLCFETHYSDGNSCPQKKPPMEPCTQDHQCVFNSSCDKVEDVCRCKKGFFETST
ncbi:unnamed protein product, partial [Lymnaea stagnalis]